MKHLIKLSAFLLCCLFGLACNKSDDDLCELDPPNHLIDCTFIYDPVCGCNDVTYGNPCFATAAGVSSFTPGVCP